MAKIWEVDNGDLCRAEGMDRQNSNKSHYYFNVREAEWGRYKYQGDARAVVLTFLVLRTFNTIPHVVETPKHKIIWLLL